jgi:hypothetical protein
MALATLARALTHARTTYETALASLVLRVSIRPFPSRVFYSAVLSRLLSGRNLLPKHGQLVRPEIGEDFPIHLNHRRERLTGQANHFVECLRIGTDINGFVGDAPLREPIFGTIAPAAGVFDK